jgi:type I restriction enzyme S subunit
MSDWREVSLDQIFEINRGGSPRPIDKYITDAPDGINWIMIGDAPEGTKYIENTKKRIDRSGLLKSRLVHPGDFLLTNSMSFGRPYITRTSGCIHDGWLVLSPKDTRVTHADYFYHLLGSPTFRSQFETRAAGAVVKNLNTSIIKALRIALPPVDQQRRIAAILDKADGIRRNQTTVLSIADQFLRSTFLNLFGDPVNNPRRLDQIVLTECARFISGGTPSKSNPSFWDGTFPWVSPKDMKVETISDTEDHVSEVVFEQTNLKRIQAGTPLIVVRGMILAHTVPVAMTAREVAINQDIKAIRFDERVDPLFAFWCLKVQQNEILNRVDTAAHGTKRLDIDRLGSLRITIPRSDEQRSFVSIVRKHDAFRELLRRAIVKSEAMFASLSQRAFRGEL